MVVVGLALTLAGTGAATAASARRLMEADDQRPPAVTRPQAAPLWLTPYATAANECPGLDPLLLVAIHDIETGRDPAGEVSSAGAVGPLQFLPDTWARYGTDANGNGITTAYDLEDALAAATALLCANGGGSPADVGVAIWNYNHSWQYVAAVEARVADLHDRMSR
ncbi:MAG: lytic transglycosylase domain-containing protein [Acidimicrobiales bacterium]